MSESAPSRFIDAAKSLAPQITHAATAAKQATELMFSAGSSASPFSSFGLERCVRDIHAAAQHVCVTPGNYHMAGQAFLGLDMRATMLLFADDRTTP